MIHFFVNAFPYFNFLLSANIRKIVLFAFSFMTFVKKEKIEKEKLHGYFWGRNIIYLLFIRGVFGDLLGQILGIDANVGGVGFAMLMLILLVEYLKRKISLTNRHKKD